MRIITINENKENMLIKHIIKEEIENVGWGNKVLTVKKYLDKNFVRTSSSVIGNDGQLGKDETVAWVDDKGKVLKILSDKEVFYMLQEKYKNILSNKDERDKFLKQIIKDWYAKKITKNGTLTKM